MKPEVPKPLKSGHEILLDDLKTIINSGGNTAEKAKIIEKSMSSHFKKEEEYALPPLGLLLALAEGNWDLDANAAIRMSEMLQSKLNELRADHDSILVALQNLKIVAEEENNYNSIQFVKNLNLHIEIEDQVLYPTTILIGNYLKNMSGKD